MLRRTSTFLVALLLATFSPLLVIGEESTWKMPNLNPFASPGSSSSRSSSAPTSGWKFPKLWQTTKSPARPKPKPANQPSTWSRMTTGTQQFFAKTADTLTPWDNKKPAASPTITGSNSFFTHNKPKDKESSGIAPASWWGTEKKDDSPKSVNEFLSQPRPR
jgi:hypothetical protein